MFFYPWMALGSALYIYYFYFFSLDGAWIGACRATQPLKKKNADNSVFFYPAVYPGDFAYPGAFFLINGATKNTTNFQIFSAVPLKKTFPLRYATIKKAINPKKFRLRR